MARQIYVNVPVSDLVKSMAFFSALGFTFKPEFTNEIAAGMIVADDIFVMLLTEPFFASFTSKSIADSKKTAEVMICLSCDSRAQVDELVRLARSAGGTVPREPQDHDLMYGHAFEDLDGHIWELVHMGSSEGPEAA